MRVVDDGIENGVGVGRVADQLVPFVGRDLAGDNCRSPTVAFFEDLEEVVAGGGIERFKPPIIEDEQLHTGERPQQACITAIAAREREIGKQPHALGRGRIDYRDRLCGREPMQANFCRFRLARTG